MSHTVRKAWVFALCAPALWRESVQAANFDQLAELEVTSVSRHEEGQCNAAAAVAVITREDLRRSGATHMPDALRLAPGLHVGRQNSSTWAVSACGFSSVNPEQLLVLSDTRSICTPLFAGMLWEVQDYLLEDVERVEVIRGPGAALWGSNAVDGVINITTRSARDTHGGYLQAGAGDSGGNLLALWRRETGESPDLQLRAYTLGVDLQHRLRPLANHEVTAGIDVYSSLNFRLGWRPAPAWGRSAYLKVEWRRE